MQDTERLKILLVTTSFPVGPNRTSGIFVKRLADALSRRVALTIFTPAAYQSVETDVDYTVRCFRYAPRNWQRLAHEPGGILVALRNHPWLVLLLPNFLIALFFGVLHHGKKVDVIHANWSITGIVAGLAALALGKPVITTLRGSDVSAIRHSATSRLLTLFALELNRSIVAVSQAIANELSQRWPGKAGNISVVPNGVDENILSLAKTSGKESLVVTTIGNLIPLKDIATLIKAFASTDQRSQLRIIGEGAERPMLEKLSHQLDIAGRVIFTGAVPPDEVKHELSLADIFVLSSHSEGRPNVVIEAMAAGCAIVSTDLPGVMELIESEIHGLLYKPGDVSALSNHLQRLYDSEGLRVQMGNSARSRIIELELTWPACGARYIDLYKGLLEAG